jgi:hypothetical protein
VRFTVITLLRGAPWYDLVHEDSDALLSIEPEPPPP